MNMTKFGAVYSVIINNINDFWQQRVRINGEYVRIKLAKPNGFLINVCML